MQTEMYPEQIKRPSPYSKENIARAAKKHSVELAQQWSDWTAEEWEESLIRHYRPHLNGYELAKEMERDGYSPDAEMVNELDTFDHYVSSCGREAEKEWVKLVGFNPEFSVGDDVDLGERFKDRGQYGKVSRIRHESAEYEVKVDAASNSAFIIKAENLKAHAAK